VQAGNSLSQQPKSLAGKIGLPVRQACDIPAGMREAADQSSARRISSCGKDDRGCFGCLLGGGDRRLSGSHDDVHVAVDKILGYFFKAIRLAVRPAIVDLQIVPADPPCLRNCCSKGAMNSLQAECLVAPRKRWWPAFPNAGV
jgi:hypothetical protein